MIYIDKETSLIVEPFRSIQLCVPSMMPALAPLFDTALLTRVPLGVNPQLLLINFNQTLFFLDEFTILAPYRLLTNLWIYSRKGTLTTLRILTVIKCDESPSIFGTARAPIHV
jgi:hypothetical protein